MIICHKVEHEDYNELIFEYKEIGENMKVYHVETKEAYDELMIELENKGYTWNSDAKPKNYNGFKWYEESTLIITRDKELKIVFDSISLYVCNEGENIIEYKAKGENMIQEVESDLQETKLSAEKLIKTIGEYLETLKPKFEVRDYVTVDVNGRTIIAKIDALRENKKEAHGLWYDKTKVNVKQDYWFLTDGNKFRHATPEEIAEYEAALTFHEHGRKPFEVKEGDLIRTPSEKIDLVYYPKNFSRVSFLKDGWKLIKTAEEVNKWLENK